MGESDLIDLLGRFFSSVASRNENVSYQNKQSSRVTLSVTCSLKRLIASKSHWPRLLNNVLPVN